MDRWLVRLLFVSLALNVGLAIWIAWASRDTGRAEELERGYRSSLSFTRTYQTRYDSAKVDRVVAVTRYRTLRDTLEITDTVQVRQVIELADSAIARDSVALARADSVIALKDRSLAYADSVISALKGKRPKRVTPWVALSWDPYSKDYTGSGGFDFRVIRNISLVAAAEADKNGPRALVGARLTF